MWSHISKLSRLASNDVKSAFHPGMRFQLSLFCLVYVNGHFNTHFFRQLGCLAFILRFWPKIKQRVFGQNIYPWWSFVRYFCDQHHLFNSKFLLRAFFFLPISLSHPDHQIGIFDSIDPKGSVETVETVGRSKYPSLFDDGSSTRWLPSVGTWL